MTKPKNETEREFYEPSDLARKLGLSQGIILTMIKRGDIPAIQVGSGAKRTHYRVHKEDFQKFLDSAKVQGQKGYARKRKSAAKESQE